ncbi:dienelactone hydrolase family protein [Antarcticibacterium arcticum]|uniref:Dienelactone hydrolase family protein n=1 Tax=Antarcticibacterium arcticum TaxID=2585771 RepID=A0A5B8YLW9_9FLAO|nr:dienelactone hydrolase family protein [Antarcticibacterium arcticum]QED37276.1 dienelactone hydrolase family protein [Antarcticibacterium arcticum]
MKKLFTHALVIILSLFTISCGTTKKEPTTPAEVLVTAKPVEQESRALQELSNSPRHHEWVTLQHGNREVQAFVVYPESNTKTKSIIVIHENRGLDDWARSFADKLAAEGFLVIAPDFISNTQGKKRTTDFENPDAARDAIYALEPSQVTADLDAAYQFLKKDPSANGEIAVIGFCWGGSQAFRYVTNNPEVTQAHVFYGTAPDDAEALARISTPVYGYYGGDDNRVNSTIEKTENIMKAANNFFNYVIYEGAGHAFMKSGLQPDAKEANKTALKQAWTRLLTILRE